MTFAEKVLKFAQSQKDSDDYLTNESYLPKPSLRFRAFELIKNPEDVKVVILGQDPYPNPESACGISFLDNKIQSFTDPKLAPSLRNLIKHLFQANDVKFDSIQELKQQMKVLPSVQDFFTNLSTNCGVLWLNASLTYEKGQQRRHCKFWRPVIEFVFQQLQDPVYVLMGDFAQKYESGLMKRVVKTKHPAATDFLPGTNVFSAIRDLQPEQKTNFLKQQIE